MAVTYRTTIFSRMPVGSIAERFFQTVSARTTEKTGYLDRRVSDRPIFSKEFINCVAVTIIGKVFAGLSHYDTVGETGDSLLEMLNLYEGRGEMLEKSRADSSASREKIQELAEAAGMAEGWYMAALENEKKRIPPVKYIAQMVDELRMNREDHGLSSLIFGGDKGHMGQAIGELENLRIPVMGAYDMDDGIFTHMAEEAVTLKRDIDGSAHLPDDPGHTGAVLVVPGEKELIIRDPGRGLVGIHIGSAGDRFPNR